MSEPGEAIAAAIQARGLVKHYEQGRIIALNGLDLCIERGEFVAICGPSGCGKSTLLNLIASIDRPDAGELEVAGRRPSEMSESETDAFRRSTVGMVFQLHNLLPHLTAIENVQIPMMTGAKRDGDAVERARFLLDRVGLGDRAGSLPTKLSGGERQRVAIARSLANRPEILLADEPTGSLDSKTGQQLFNLLEEIRQELRTTLVLVTHENSAADRADRVVHMLDGQVVNSGESPSGA
jgi:putative ABC transport system ATP-binding protein